MHANKLFRATQFPKEGMSEGDLLYLGGEGAHRELYQYVDDDWTPYVSKACELKVQLKKVIEELAEFEKGAENVVDETGLMKANQAIMLLERICIK